MRLKVSISIDLVDVMRPIDQLERAAHHESLQLIAVALTISDAAELLGFNREHGFETMFSCLPR